MDYQYPLDYEWSTNEIVDVIHLYEAVEQAYEKGIARVEFMNAYRRFKEIVPSIAQEKKLGNEFEELSGYSLYRVVQKTKNMQENEKIKMNAKVF